MRQNLVPFVFCLFFLAINANQEQLKVPETFGLMTVTHARGSDISNILNYMQKYAQMDCPIISEINIVWNNQVSPESVGVFTNKSEWKRPVYFFQTPNNSMDWRYSLTNESKAQVFFEIDDDINLSCSQLMISFKVWQQHAIGNIGPIVTYGPRFIQYTQKQGFHYGKVKEKDMFSIGLVGVAFISRYFMDLYYADIQIIKQMRKVVRQKNNCDDIALNWIIAYFFPELQTIPVFTNRDLLVKGPKISQGHTKTHYPYRNQCVKTFTQLFGINPLRYAPIHDASHLKNLRFLPMRKQTVLAKKTYFDQFLTNYVGKSNISQYLLKQNVNIPSKPEAKDNEQILQYANKIKQMQKQLSETKIENQKLMLRQKALQDEIKQIQDEKSKYFKTNKEQSVKIIQMTDQMKTSQNCYYFVYILILAIILLVWKLINLVKIKNSSLNIDRHQSNQSHIQLGEESSKIYHYNE